MIWLVACAPPAAEADPPEQIRTIAESEPVRAPYAASPGGATVHEAFPPPFGATRVDGGAFGTWIGSLGVRAADEPVRTFDGAVVPHAARVVDLPMVPGDLQQCADAAIRLRAEWERSAGMSPVFHATSGDPMPWSRFEAGETPYESNGRIAWKAGSSRKWEDWLVKVFTWAGTRSIAYDTVAATEPVPGDVLVQGGSPGHAIVLLDVAREGDAIYVLVGESYMPAQSFHVELGPYGGWWAWDDGVTIPTWRGFDGDDLRRWSTRGQIMPVDSFQR